MPNDRELPPTRSKHAALLNRLDEMQQSPYYATARATLAEAERVIVEQEAALQSARSPAGGEVAAQPSAEGKWMPKEPTPEMLYAMAECDGYKQGDRDHPMLTQWEDYWHMAYEAAPQSVSPPPTAPDTITMPLEDACALLTMLDRHYGNEDGLDWHDEEAGAVADALQKAGATERAIAHAATPKATAPVAGETIYVASRASLDARPQMWRDLRAAGWPINSTWIDEAGPEETKSFPELWQRIVAEVTAAAGVVLYAEAEDFPLKGAYIEVGIALGQGKRVAVVLPDVEIEYPHIRPIGSWVQHPLVMLCDNLGEARRWVQAATPTPASASTGAVMRRTLELIRDWPVRDSKTEAMSMRKLAHDTLASLPPQAQGGE